MHIKIIVSVHRKSDIYYHWDDPEGKSEAEVDIPDAMLISNFDLIGMGSFVKGLLPCAIAHLEIAETAPAKE